MRLFTKFFLSVTVLITAITLGIVYVVLSRERQLIVEEAQAKGRSLAKLMAVSSAGPILQNEYSALRAYTEAITPDHDIVYVLVADPQGVIKMHSDVSLIGEKFAGPAFRRDTYEIVEPVMASGIEIGLIRIGISTRKMQQEIAKSRNRILFMGGIAILVGMAGSYAMGRTISRPVQDLVQSTKAISSGDWKIQLKAASRDEVGLLTEAFHDMAAALRRNVQEMVRNEKLVTLGKMAAGVAHEVKNPLEAIKGSAEYLRGKYPDDPTIVKFTTIIKDEIDDVARFLDEYLQFARPAKPRFASRDLNSLLLETLGFLEKLIEQKRLGVETRLDPSLPWVLADALQIKQVFLNVLLNAVEASEPGGRLALSTRLRKGDGDSADPFARFDHVVIEIADAGKGISPEHLAKLFEPFFSTKETGSGLGLSICQGIVERHKGRIEIESELGRGALVRILLPT